MQGRHCYFHLMDKEIEDVVISEVDYEIPHILIIRIRKGLLAYII